MDVCFVGPVLFSSGRQVLTRASLLLPEEYCSYALCVPELYELGCGRDATVALAITYADTLTNTVTSAKPAVKWWRQLQRRSRLHVWWPMQ